MFPASIVVGGTNPSTVIVDPSGLYAYVASDDGYRVAQYIIGTTDGALKHISETMRIFHLPD
jgi:6-phosphogluconolactonase (cycloisomerase 2 family)